MEGASIEHVDDHVDELVLLREELCGHAQVYYLENKPAACSSIKKLYDTVMPTLYALKRRLSSCPPALPIHG